jgi:hypothetical protein
MKTFFKLAFILILESIFNNSFCQSKIIEFEKFNSKIIVFSENYQDKILESLTVRFTPDSSTIYEIEKYLFENNIEKASCKKINFRQYVGFKKNDNFFVLVKVINFRKEKKLKKIFPDWEKEYAFILTDLENLPSTPEFLYNLDLKMLTNFEWGKND